MIAPLLFSFNDEEIPGTLAVRVGTGLHPNGIAQWSSNFHMQTGIQVKYRPLNVNCSFF